MIHIQAEIFYGLLLAVGLFVCTSTVFLWMAIGYKRMAAMWERTARDTRYRCWDCYHREAELDRKLELIKTKIR